MQFRSDELLPGEEPDSPHVDDARHWASVYAELVTAVTELASVSPGQPDMVRQRERFEDRLTFWRERMRHLGTPVSESIGTIEAG